MTLNTLCSIAMKQVLDECEGCTDWKDLGTWNCEHQATLAASNEVFLVHAQRADIHFDKRRLVLHIWYSNNINDTYNYRYYNLCKAASAYFKLTW